MYKWLITQFNSILTLMLKYNRELRHYLSKNSPAEVFFKQST